MGRANHKPDCQCAVCKRVRAKEAAVAVAEPVEGAVSGPKLSEVPIGQPFRADNKVWKKINSLPGSEDRVLDVSLNDDATSLMSKDKVVEIIVPGHLVEPDP